MFQGKIQTNLSRDQIKAEMFKAQSSLIAAYDKMYAEAEQGTAGGTLNDTYKTPAEKEAVLRNIQKMRNNALRPYQEFMRVNKKEGGMIEAPKKKSRRSVFDFT